jgi:hypothetical protein
MLLPTAQHKPTRGLDRLTGHLRDALEAIVVDPGRTRPAMIGPTRREAVAVTVIGGAIAAIAFAMSDRFPIWIDEVMGIDPGASLLFGDGFSSTAWPFQTRAEYWAGNSPLYYALLADWMRAVGFGVAEARSFNYLLAVIAGVLLWWGCCRLAILRTPTTRLLFVVTFLAGHGVTLNIWSARHDCLTMVLAALCLLNVTIPSQSARTIGFVVLGALLPMSGLHVLFYIGLLTAVSLLVFRRDAMPAASALGAGVTLGMAFLYLMFHTNGVWFKFLFSTVGAQHSITGQLAQVAVQGDMEGLRRLMGFPLAFLEDHSFAVILAAAVVAFWLTPRGAPFRLRASAQLAIVSGALIPTALFLAGKFPIYYGWMALAPTAMFVFAWGEEYFGRSASAMWRWPLIITMAACLAGLPTYVAKSIGLPVTERNTAIDSTARTELHADDWVYADYASYVSARRVATVVMVAGYGNSALVPGLPERERVTALFVSPRNLEAAIERVGGEWTVSTTDWKPSADATDNTPRIYRRR